MKLLRYILASLTAAALAGLIYISANKIPETCNGPVPDSSLGSGAEANCVHYRYSEYKTPLITVAVASVLGLLVTFVIRKPRK